MKTSSIESVLFMMAVIAIAMFLVAFAMPSDVIAAATTSDSASFVRYPGGPTAPANFPWSHMPVLPDQARPELIPPPFWCPPVVCK